MKAGFDFSMAEADEEFPWVPTIDGPNGLVPDLPSKLFEKKQFANIPFISGDVLDEGEIYYRLPLSSVAKNSIPIL